MIFLALILASPVRGSALCATFLYTPIRCDLPTAPRTKVTRSDEWFATDEISISSSANLALGYARGELAAHSSSLFNQDANDGCQPIQEDGNQLGIDSKKTGQHTPL